MVLVPKGYFISEISFIIEFLMMIIQLCILHGCQTSKGDPRHAVCGKLTNACGKEQKNRLFGESLVADQCFSRSTDKVIVVKQ